MPTTWADWRRAMEDIKRTVGKDRWAIFLPTNEWAQPAILGMQAGSPLLKDGGRWGAFSDPEFLRAFEFYLGLYRDGLAPVYGNTDIANVFQEFERVGGNEPFWDHGGSDGISTDRQRATWGVSTDAVGQTVDRTIDDMITFSVPITLGEPFNLGIYGFADAGKRSSSGVPGSSSAGVDFGITWVEARVVDGGGVTIAGATISGETGLDWPGGPAACPADLAAPLGVLNFFDVSAFLAAYNAQDPAADFAEPFGVFNFFDLSAFLAAYNAGCP